MLSILINSRKPNADDLVLRGEPEEDPRAMVGCFAEGYRRRVLKVNAGRRKVMMRDWSVRFA